MPPKQAFADDFQREQGCTEADWQRCLPEAVRSHALQSTGGRSARVAIGTGTLHLTWTPLPPRRIALLAMPRLQVHYRFDGVDAAARSDFMQYFDLVMQRGGG